MRKVEANIEINAAPTRVLSAFTNPTMLKGWWGVERQLIVLEPGMPYSLVWQISNTGMGYVSTGIVESYAPGDHLKVKDFIYFNAEKDILGPMSLDIRVAPKEKVTLLSVCQDGYQSGGDWDWYYEAVMEAWPQALKIIKAYLEN